MNRARLIFHLDMNSFFASVEIAHNPSLQGKPVAIAGNPEERRGIIVTSSYEARSKGVKTTMPIWEAKKLCPNLIILRPNGDRYREASNRCSTYYLRILRLCSKFQLMKDTLI
ncbi:DNA polymerase IV [Halalkalibacter wakoensis JCM 9140]|uniref:DNA-directed DNA polymerase n=1 Tax=Halalkalibacter wakoensis JCM 9140 TaxID=1236970 RepID=W4PYP0_9BACI|nr:DNA polymerase IV [Halalkalibacter wakoensis JCM 9140]